MLYGGAVPVSAAVPALAAVPERSANLYVLDSAGVVRRRRRKRSFPPREAVPGNRERRSRGGAVDFLDSETLEDNVHAFL